MRDFRRLVFLVLTVVTVGCNPFDTKSKKEIWTESSKKNSPPATTTVPWHGEAVAADTFIKIAKKADPAVVNIGTTKVDKNPGSPDDFLGDDFFRFFFGGPGGPGGLGDEPRERKQRSLGSGFVISEDGYIVTNNHVVEKADEINVTIGRDHEYRAKIIGTDPKTDLALIKIEPKEPLTVLAFGDSEQLQVGEIVVAIGNPFGLSHTVTQGIVSAKERAIDLVGPYDSFIQTDASINPGNSGGPLLNLRAEVVGINSAIHAGGQGIGFAIPVNVAKNVISQLRETGTVTRGWLGVFIQKVDSELAKSLGLKEAHGALVAEVQKNSPAAKAKIQVGDVIIKFNESEIIDYNELPRQVAGTSVGKKVRLELMRDGKKIVVEPVVEKLDVAAEGRPPKEEEESAKPSEPGKLGIAVSTLTEKISRQLGLDPSTKGVVVERVRSDSSAAEKGLKRGDVIVEINRQKVSNVSVFEKVAKGLKKGNAVLLLVKRGSDASLFIAFTM